MLGHYSNILCVLSQINESSAVAAQALHVANSHQARLTFQLALESLPPNASLVMASFAYIESHKSIADEATQRLEEMVASLSPQQPVGTKVTIGRPYYDVIQQVINGGYDLVITQAQSGMTSFVYGADAMHLIRKCPCPVWLVQQQTARNYSSVLATVDVNYHFTAEENAVRKQLNEDVLASAAEVALLENAQLHIVHVYQPPAEHMIRDGLMPVNQQLMDSALEEIKHERQQQLELLVSTLAQRFDDKSLAYLKPQVHLLTGYPASAIARAAEQLNADVVVMGTVARVGIPGLLMGNTAEDILNNLDCAVLALKPGGFKTIIPPHN
ncbi:universal stress protein [Alteromonas lipolytica]|uniref:UspA domain-containing protein n=1 Tax=Alteromonas lipolytica TaxID=1856405 RepID=A0A1E8FD36_9ALTE|nr:universal stress protein [Alteromonas lipolytica]OFI33842.1 hypothetical protein BFC17_19940 [Alteromonas lipolytica]GGF67926.1 universal stress protein [Alteromonas lipolytica]